MHAICAKLGIDSNLVSATVARSAEGMWNPLYGTRGGVPFGGACLPKDTAAFRAFVEEQGRDHLMLEATIEVNDRLRESVPAATSPDKIDEALALAGRRNGHGQEQYGELMPVLLDARMPRAVSDRELTGRS